MRPLVMPPSTAVRWHAVAAVARLGGRRCARPWAHTAAAAPPTVHARVVGAPNRPKSKQHKTSKGKSQLVGHLCTGTMRVVDLFAGLGGFSAGALDAGAQVILGVDHDPVPLKL